MTTTAQDSTQDSTQDTTARISYFDVVEQQLLAMKSQALATIASCDSALVTVRLLNAQLATAQQRAAARHADESPAPTRPATFGKHRSPDRSQG